MKEAEATPADRPSQDAILLAALGYLPLFFFLPLFAGTKEPFARFHGRQSLVLFVTVLIFQVAVWLSDLVLGRILGNMFLLGFFFKAVAWLVHYPTGFLVAAVYAVLVIVGIVQAATGQYWRVPILGVYAERLKL